LFPHRQTIDLKETVLQLFEQYPQAAIIISLLLSIVVAVLGLVPSFFITAANILFFGFWQGTAISFAGEALGAAVSFLLYRKGFRKTSQKGLERFPKAQQLVNAEGKQAFWLVLSLRLFPFVPSGLITFAAAIGKISFWNFLIASSLGKIPALLIEAYSVYQVTKFGWQGKAILALVGIALIYFLLRKRKKEISRRDTEHTE
jgi:uncharacterized membrane protein YdjX (TVP38/TMEM64 family)